MKAAIFGGTFNPVHAGHLVIGASVLRGFDFDKVLFIPAFIPPHKNVDDPGPEIRLEMLSAAIAPFEGFAVSDCEISRRGISYTIDTVRELVAKGVVEQRPGVLIGDDLASGFSRWRLASDLAKEARIIVVHRSTRRRLALDFPHEYLDNEITPLSSSEVRTLIKSGGAWKNLVPARVAEIIESRRLYGL